MWVKITLLQRAEISEQWKSTIHPFRKASPRDLTGVSFSTQPLSFYESHENMMWWTRIQVPLWVSCMRAPLVNIQPCASSTPCPPNWVHCRLQLSWVFISQPGKDALTIKERKKWLPLDLGEKKSPRTWCMCVHTLCSNKGLYWQICLGLEFEFPSTTTGICHWIPLGSSYTEARQHGHKLLRTLNLLALIDKTNLVIFIAITTRFHYSPPPGHTSNYPGQKKKLKNQI